MLFNFALPLIVLCGYFFAICRHTTLKPHWVPFVLFPSLLFLLYCAALCAVLKLATITLIVIGYSCFAIYSMLYIYDRVKNNNKPLLVNKASVFLLLFVFLIWLYVQSFYLMGSDSFAYWALISKFLYYFNRLPNGHDLISQTHLAYTPGLGLWQYFFFTITQHYSLSISYYAQDLFLLAPIVAISSQKSTGRYLIFFTSLLLYTLFFGTIFANLQVDALLCAYLVTCFWVLFQSKAETSMWYLLPALSTLVLIKEAGLALILIFMVMVCLFLSLNREKNKLSKLLPCLIGFIIALVIDISWHAHLHHAAIPAFSRPLSVQAIIDSFNFKSALVIKGVENILESIFFTAADALNLPFIAWYGALIYIWVVIIRKNYPQRRHLLSTAVALLVGYALFLLGYYLLQFTKFNPAVFISAPHRYLAIFFSAIASYTVLLLLILNTNQKTKFVLSIIITLLFFTVTLASWPQRYHEGEKNRLLYTQLVKKISHSVHNKQSIVCLVTNKYELTAHAIDLRLSYRLLPISVVTYTTVPTMNCRYILIYHPSATTLVQLKRHFKMPIKEGLYQASEQGLTRPLSTND